MKQAELDKLIVKRKELNEIINSVQTSVDTKSQVADQLIKLDAEIEQGQKNIEVDTRPVDKAQKHKKTVDEIVTETVNKERDSTQTQDAGQLFKQIQENLSKPPDQRVPMKFSKANVRTIVEAWLNINTFIGEQFIFSNPQAPGSILKKNYVDIATEFLFAWFEVNPNVFAKIINVGAMAMLLAPPAVELGGRFMARRNVAKIKKQQDENDNVSKPQQPAQASPGPFVNHVTPAPSQPAPQRNYTGPVAERKKPGPKPGSHNTKKRARKIK